MITAETFCCAGIFNEKNLTKLILRCLIISENVINIVWNTIVTMFRHNYPDQYRHGNYDNNDHEHLHDSRRPGSRHGDHGSGHFDSHGPGGHHDSQGHSGNYVPHADHGGFGGGNTWAGQGRDQRQGPGHAQPLMSLQIQVDGEGFDRKNNSRYVGGEHNPSSSIIRYRSRSPDHRVANNNFSPGMPVMEAPRISQGNDQLPDKVYECLGQVLLVQDFLECGVLQLRGADGRAANCLFFRKDVLVHARMERMSLETPQNSYFKANAWMMNRDWSIPYLASSVWVDGADIPPIAMSKIFSPPHQQTVELYQTFATDLAWQIPAQPTVLNPIFAQAEVEGRRNVMADVARRNVVLVDDYLPPRISPGRKVVLVEGSGPGHGPVRQCSPMRQLRDSLRGGRKQEELQRSRSPRSSMQAKLPDVPVVNIDDESPVRINQSSRSPRRRSRSRSKRRRRSPRRRSPIRRRSRSSRRSGSRSRRRSRSPRRRSRSQRKRSRSPARSARMSRSRSPKRRRSRSRDHKSPGKIADGRGRRSRSRDRRHRSKLNETSGKSKTGDLLNITIIEDGTAATIKTFINDEIGMLSVLPGWKDISNQSIVSSMKPVYFHVDQVWTRTNHIGLHQFREIYQTKELKKRFPVDCKVWCNIRRIKSDEAEYQAVVICLESDYEEWKEKVGQMDIFLNHSLEYNLSVVQYMETRKQELILNPFPDTKAIAVEAKVHEYFSLDVGFLKLCSGDTGVVLFHTNQVIIPKLNQSWTRLKHSLKSENKTMIEHLPLGMTVQVVLYQIPCHGCSQLKYQAQAVYKQAFENLEDPLKDFNTRYGRLKEKLELKKTLDQQFDTFKRLTKLESSPWSRSFLPVHAVLNGLPQGWQAVVVAVVNREFGIIRISRTDEQPLYSEKGNGVTVRVLHVLFHIEDVYDVHGYRLTSSNMSMDSLTDQFVDLTARTICKRNKPASIFEVQHNLSVENSTYVGIPLLQAIVVCVKMNLSSPPVTRSVPKPTVLRRDPGSFDSGVSAFYIQYSLKVKLDIKVVQFLAIKNKPSLPYQKHIISNYSFRDEKEVVEGLKSIDCEGSQQLLYGKLEMKDVKIPTGNLPAAISRIECSIKYLYRSNLVAERGVVEIKPLVDRKTVTCLAYFQYSDLYKQQEQDFQCKDLAILMPARSNDKFCVSVQLWNPEYKVPYIVTVIWNETLRLKLGMPEPRPAPCTHEALSYREPLIKEVVASCQDEVEVVDASLQEEKKENPAFKKIKVPPKAGKAIAGITHIYQDFVALEPDGSVVEYFDDCRGVVEKVIGSHYLIISLPETQDSKKIRVLATSSDIIANQYPESLDSVTKISNSKAAHTGINLYDLAKPGDNVRFNAVLLAADDSTIQYCSTCVVMDPKRYMAKLIVPSNPEELLRPLPLPTFVPLLPIKSSKPFGNLWKETYQKIVSALDGNLNLEGSKIEIARILSTKAPNKVSGMDVRPPPIKETGFQQQPSRSDSKSSESGLNSASKETERTNLVYVPTTKEVGLKEKMIPKSDIDYDPYAASKIYGRVVKILNPNYGVGVCQQFNKDGSSQTIQVLFDIFDVWIDEQVVAKMNKKLPDVMKVGDYLLMLCIKVEDCEGPAKRVVEHMATAVAVGNSYEEVKTMKFPAVVVPLERIELIDESKIDNFRKVVKILKGMTPGEGENKIIEDVGKQTKPCKVEKESPTVVIKEELKENETSILRDEVLQGNENVVPSKSELPKAVFGLSFKNVAKDPSTMQSTVPLERSVISIFTVKVVKNIEGSYWLGCSTNEMSKKCAPKRVLINAVMLEKSLLVQEGMILNCDISDAVVEDPNDTEQVYHIAKSVKVNPDEEILLDDRRWKEKTMLSKYKPVVKQISNVDFTNSQCRQLLGKVVPGDFFLNSQSIPKFLINQTGVVLSLIDESSAIIRMDVKDKTERGLKFLHILADNEYRSNIDKEIHPNFCIGYPATFHAIKLDDAKDQDVQYLATDICLHLDPYRYEKFLECGNKVSIEAVQAFPVFKQVKQKLVLVSPDQTGIGHRKLPFKEAEGLVKAVDEEVVLIEHGNSEGKHMSLYFKTASERVPKTKLTVKDGQHVLSNVLYINWECESLGLATKIWFPGDQPAQSYGYKDVSIENVKKFNEKAKRILSPSKLQHLTPRNFLKLQNNHKEEELSRMINVYVKALEETVEIEGVIIPAALSFQSIITEANCEITAKDAKEFLILLGDVCQESIGPKKEAFWDIALCRDLKIGNMHVSSEHAIIIKEKGLINTIKLLPRTRRNLITWRYPEDWVKVAEQYSNVGIDGSSFSDCPPGWSRVEDSKLLAGALEHGLLFPDSNLDKSWANLADDLGYGLGSRIIEDGVLQPFVPKRLEFLKRVCEGRGRFVYDCENLGTPLLISNVTSIKDEGASDEEINKSSLFNYEPDISCDLTEDTVMVKEEYFEIGDALALASNESQEMENLNKALEEMERAAAVVETSYESEMDVAVALESLEKSLFTPAERQALVEESKTSPSEEVTISEPSLP